MESKHLITQKRKRSVDSYTTFKFLRACDNCRARKIKCVMRQNVCEYCRSHNINCSFENRIKDDRKSEETLSFSLQDRTPSEGLPPDAETFSKQNIYQHRPRATTMPDIENMLSDVLDMHLGSLDKSGREIEYVVLLYRQYVEPFSPFVHVESFYHTRDTFHLNCIKLAATYSLIPCNEAFDVNLMLQEVHNRMKYISEWGIGHLECFFLLPSLINISSEVIERALDRFLMLYNANSKSIPINLVVGAMSVDAWNSVLNSSKLKLPPHLFHYFERFLRYADNSILHYHIIELNHLMSQYLNLTENPLTDYNATRQRLLQLEYDILLLPAKLPKQFLVVKDRLTSSREAMIYHILHNVLLTSIYTKAVTSKMYGKMQSIYAIAGLYHFLCGLIRSTLEVGEEKAGPWALVSDCMVHSLKCGLSLLDAMDFEDLVLVMANFKMRSNVRFPALQEKLANEVYSLREQYTDYQDYDRVDGSLIFWVFRDVRSMTLAAYLGKNG